MRLLALLDDLLAFLGGHATRVLFLGVFLGLAVPPLAALARPLLGPTVLALLLAMLLRIDWSAMGEYMRRPVLATLLTLWLLIGAPVLTWLILQPSDLPANLTTSLVLMAAAPPILTSAAIAALLKLDGALAIVAGLVSTLLVPLTLPPLALGLLAVELDVSAAVFMVRLAAIVGAAFLLAALIRRLTPTGWLSAHASQIDGLVVVGMLIFAIAVMDGVTATLIERPAFVGLLVLAAFLANLGLQLLAIAVFAWLGRRGAFTVGLMTGNRNMGLLLAALPPESPFEVLLYFAVAQLPIFMLPALTAPIYRRLLSVKGNPPI